MEVGDIGTAVKKVPIRNVTNATKGQASPVRSGSSFSFGKSGFPGLSQSCSSATSVQQTLPVRLTEANVISKYELDVGPFVVILESLQNNLGSFHPMSIGKLIIQHHKE